MALEIATSIEVKGPYTLEGDQLTLTPNMDTYKADLISVSMNGQVANNPMVKAQVKSMLSDPSFKEEFSKVENVTVKVGESSLEMTDGEQTLNFARFATIQN